MMLLVAVDIEGCASGAVDVAGQLALDLDCPMTLLCVASFTRTVPKGFTLPDTHETVDQLVRHESRVALEGLAAAWIDRDVRVAISVRFGAIQEVVLETITQMNPRYLVLGTHGRVGLKRWVFGSVEESITRRCEVPVLVVPGYDTVDHLTPLHRALLVEQEG